MIDLISIGILIAGFIFFTELCYLSTARIINKRLDFFEALCVKLLSIFLGAFLTVLFGFVYDFLLTIDYSILKDQIIAFGTVATVVIGILIILFLWVKINQYIGNKMVERRRR